MAHMVCVAEAVAQLLSSRAPCEVRERLLLLYTGSFDAGRSAAAWAFVELRAWLALRAVAGPLLRAAARCALRGDAEGTGGGRSSWEQLRGGLELAERASQYAFAAVRRVAPRDGGAQVLGET